MPTSDVAKLRRQRDAEDEGISFYINGKRQSVARHTGRYSARTTLSEYIRDTGLTGIKLACQESGCGACAVAATFPDVQHPGHYVTRAINTCLCPLFSVDGWQITTVEGLGCEKEGFHPIQKRIAKKNGSQCGFCTPGVIMTMYSLLQENPAPTEKAIEDNFDGNLCRCTGYRAILDSMKSFGADCNHPDDEGVIDIEDLNKKLCPGTGKACKGSGDHNIQVDTDGAVSNGATANGASDNGNGGEFGAPVVRRLQLQLDQTLWVRPLSLQELGDLLHEHRSVRVRMVFGNTAAGIFKHEGSFDVYLDISCVKELSEVKVEDTGLQVGAGLTLSALITHLEDLQSTRPGFAYFQQLVHHLKLVGSVLLRNAGSLGGNLCVKHAHPDFPSDVFTMLEAAGATVCLYDSWSGGSKTQVSLVDLVTRVDMQGKVIVSVHLPALDPVDHYRSFKVTPRAQNAHAYVNAAFKIKMTQDHKQILGKPALVFGGIDDKTIHATETEQFLAGKEVTSALIQEGLVVLKAELCPSTDNTLASPQYRTDLALSLLYKTLLGLVTPSDPRLSSGAESLERPLSSAVQTFQEKTEEWPLKQPQPKKTALLQTSGEALFVGDIPRSQHELNAAFVLSTVARARVLSVDPSPALAMPGVVRYLSASDIPGKNVLAPWSLQFDIEPEELLSSGKIDYAGQPIGIILAETQQLADLAAQQVVVNYTDVEQPILTIQEGIAANSFNSVHNVRPINVGDPDKALKEAKNVLEGEVSMGAQYHFYMENQTALCVPSEDGIEVFSSTQDCDLIQAGVAGVLGKPANFVNMHIQRLGGGFGGKQVTSCFPASAAAVAANCTGRPVRMNMSLSANMAVAGKRFPVLAKYKVGYTDEGKLQVLVVDVYMDGGFTYTCNNMLHEVVIHMDLGYHVPNCRVTPFNVRTNKPTSVACRSPGPVPASLIMETVQEHIAKVINKHPIIVKELNLYDRNQTDLAGHVLTYCTLKDVWTQLKSLAEVESRITEIQAFNEANRWKKRGLTMNGIKHGLLWSGPGFPAQVSIFASDGTVTVSQSGVEMGQGLYTKVAQATAHSLGIPMSMVKVRPNQSLIANNARATGGSTTSEQCVYAVQQCCQMLRERLAPVQAKYPDADWPTLCRKSLEAKVDLGARYTNFGEPASPYFNYFAYCAGVFETELDVLTGEFLIRRVDIMYDCGESLNPLIDIGQIEGAFIMGLGCHLMEDIIHDSQTGRILNDGTWEYKIPTTKDIPIDWRIHLLPDAPNPVGVNSSKAVGEPPIAMGCGPLLALRQCMEAARQDLSGSSAFVSVDSPLTVEKIQQGCRIGMEHMKL